MRTSHKLNGALLIAVLSATGCNQGPLFYAELEEPRLCKTIEDLPPFFGTPPGTDLRIELGIPIASELPLFEGGDGAEAEIQLIEFALLAKSGILDFNGVDSATITVRPAPGSSQDDAVLLFYTRDPADLPGDTLIVSGNEEVNLVPYIFDPGTSDGGTPSALDGGTAEEGTIVVEAVMSGELPEDSWTADVRACIYMRTRFNYLDAYGL